jgi:hypothetical protein
MIRAISVRISVFPVYDPQGLNGLRKNSLLPVDRGPQRLKPDLFKLSTYGLKAVPFKNLGPVFPQPKGLPLLKSGPESGLGA